MNITLTSNIVIPLLVRLIITYLITYFGDFNFLFLFFSNHLITLFLGIETSKKVSSTNYYAQRLIFRLNKDNYILRYRHLHHQYLVDVIAKIESER